MNGSDSLPDPHSPGHVAIVGCGPSGCYTALALRRVLPQAHITIFDGRPTPFGLLRYGVAADHQGMKGVSRQFDRLFTSANVEFVGNTVVGRDISLEQVEAAFDVVVIATGLSQDRPLDIPYPQDAPVFGAGQILRMFNADPDSGLHTLDDVPTRPLGSDLLIVGSGNVSMDLARLVCKSDEGFAGSDIHDEALAALETAGVRRITILSRSPRERVRWDPAMFSELCALPGVAVSVDGAVEVPRDNGAKYEHRQVDVHFSQTPVSIEHHQGRLAVHTARTDGEGRGSTFLVNTVITAMGFVPAPLQDNPVAHAQSDRFVRVGGAGGGALGNLAENRTLAKSAAEEIARRLRTDAGRSGLATLREAITQDAVAFGEWQAIDRAEIQRARPGRIRSKFATRAEMAAIVAEHRRSVGAIPEPSDPPDDRKQEEP